MSSPPPPRRSLRYLLLLVLAGAAVFILPFVLPRVFRPTVLSVYGIDNTDLGVCFAVYGFVALGAYLLGGPLADRFLPRHLMGTALVLTAAAGPVYAAVPTLAVLKIIYGYWGFTTIFLFWAAMIKATRVWGGDGAQGRAFGFLDGGRGLVGALFGLLGVVIFGALAGPEVGAVAADHTAAFRRVVYVCSGLVATVGVAVFFFLRGAGAVAAAPKTPITRRNLLAVLRLPAVWLMMVIIVCAYVGYRVTDVLTQYAVDVMGYGEVAAARTGTFLLFIRPAVGVGVGLLADRSRPTRYLTLAFGTTIVGCLLFAGGWLGPGLDVGFYLSLVFLAVGVYACRALYFAVLPEGNVPLVLTGTAVGVISFVGYTPDIFAGLLFGYFLDTYPGEVGHRYVYGVLAVFSAVGLVAAAVLRRRSAYRSTAIR